MQKNVLEYLENSAKSFPDKLAYADENERVTFSELENEAKRIGTNISNKLNKINSPIAVVVDRNIRSLIAFFGVLYSGNYYVPIDNKMPKKRMETVLESLKPSLIIYFKQDEELVENLNDYNKIEFDEVLNSEIDEHILLENRNKILNIDPVYIIFTSGSTGVPKGIVIPHKNVIDFIDWMAEKCEFSSDDIMANQAPFYFDLSVKDIYLTLKCAATTYILPKKMFMFPILLVNFFNENKVTSLIWATSAFNLIANSNVLSKAVPKYLKKVVLGGEALLASKLNVWRNVLPNVQYINLYGPTEVTVDCTYYKIEKEFKDYEAIPIGKACENKEVLLLDENLEPVPDGDVGEICVRGTGLAKGYYNDSEKTSKAFIQNPLNPYFPDIIYRTGDLGRKLDDGMIYFETRKDGQIKHGGYRIELGEIERALNSFSKISAAVCVYKKEEDKIVCIYEGNATDEEIVNHIKTLLPKYMFPNRFIKLDAMPYNANGKIDRVKLKNEYV